MRVIDKQTIQKFDKPGPRYTSYPTAPEWTTDVSEDVYKEKLKAFGQSDKTLSLYVHIPFCETLCYFCACMMNVRKQEEKYGNEYVEHLSKELDLITPHIGRKKEVRQLHWGGGTPSFLSEGQMEQLFAKITQCFDINLDSEVAVEVDPRRVTKSKVETLRRLGFNRISIGVQDFEPTVQEHINRIQPFGMVETFSRWCRGAKFDSVNFDLIYGLPYQTPETFRRTVDQVMKLRPDRIALYSYAYVPWLKKHQQKIKADTLPSPDEKLEIFLNAREQFLSNGYEAIAMDHFALKEDELAKAFQAGALYRNFMGYTVKPADEYVGIGTSAIGFLEKSFFHNYKTIPEYYKCLAEGRLPIERGKILTRDDEIRQWVIRSIMCQFVVDKGRFSQVFGVAFDEYFKDEQGHIKQCCDDELLVENGECLECTELGRIFVRNICMGFDWYLRQKSGHKRFSRTI